MMPQNKLSNLRQSRHDFLSGLTVSLALVPEAIAFAMVAGVAPLIGLHAAFLIGLITALLGRQGMISGATGAMAVVMVPLVASHGVEYLFAAVILTGLLQLIAGLFKLGRFITLVPHPVMMGFVNGLAMVIFIAQLGQFKQAGPDGILHWLPAGQLLPMLALVSLTMAIIFFLPRLTKVIPSSLGAIVIVSLLSVIWPWDVKTVGDIASVSGGLPRLHVPELPLNFDMIKIIFPYSLILAAVGLIESLLTVNLIDEITGEKGKLNRECIAQGLANFVTGFFGGMGGCAMLGQSMINITSGGRGRLSGVTAALALMIFIVFGSSLIDRIPVAALTGVMFVVVFKTFEWSTFKTIKKIPLSDAFVIVFVSLVTVFTDLAVAVVSGVVVSALCFAWKHAKVVSVDRQKMSSNEDENNTVYTVTGPIFFGSVARFMEKFSPETDGYHTILDLSGSKICDHSAIEAIDVLRKKYEKLGKMLILNGLGDECQSVLGKATGDI